MNLVPSTGVRLGVWPPQPVVPVVEVDVTSWRVLFRPRKGSIGFKSAVPSLGGWHESTGCQILKSDQACKPTYHNERGPSISFRSKCSFLPPAMAGECCVPTSASGVGTGRGR